MNTLEFTENVGNIKITERGPSTLNFTFGNSLINDSNNGFKWFSMRTTGVLIGNHFYIQLEISSVIWLSRSLWF